MLVDPPVRDRATARGGRAARAPDRPHDRDAHARRPRLRARPARPRARHPGQHPCRPQASTTRTTRWTTATTIEVGAVTLGVIHTPGHRPEHCCLTVIDRSRGDEPWLVLTGDSLFVGDAARPDLAVGAAEGAEGLFHSLHRLLELSDGVEVFPGHVAGSLCGKSMSSKPSTTIGFERRFNPTLQITESRRSSPSRPPISAPKPPNLARIVEANRGPFVGAPPLARGARRTTRRTPNCSTCARCRRTSTATARARSTCRSPASSFATKAGFVLDAAQPVCVLADTVDEARRRDSRAPLGRVLRHRRATCSAAATSTRDGVTIDELEELDRRRRRGDRRAGEGRARDRVTFPAAATSPYRLRGDVLSRPPRRPPGA